MEFITKNFINTTGSIVVGSNTDSSSFMFSTDLNLQYVTNGFASDLTTASIRINFDVTTTVSRIALQNINLKDFTIFFNGATTSTFNLTAGAGAGAAATTTSDFATNSETSMYLTVGQVDCTSVTIDMTGTQVADAEKAIGFYVISSVLHDLSRLPSADDYKPLIDPKRVEHKLSDGGTRIHDLRDVVSADIKYKNLPLSDRDSIRTVYDLRTDFMFCAFPTTTSWDTFFFPCVWIGPFDFLKFSDNAPGTGFSGNIKLRQTSQ